MVDQDAATTEDPGTKRPAPPCDGNSKHDRHDFNKPVRTLLEQQAGSLCSNPGCRQPTRAASFDAARSINIGTAAHLTAAAPGGPRYDPGLTKEQRESHENGIWLCRNCGTLVDDDEGGFPLKVLVDWKKAALQENREAIITPARRITPLPAGTAEDAAALENDRSRFQRLVQQFPTSSGSVLALRQFDAAHQFERAPIDKLALLHEWTTPEQAFSNPTVQAALVTLTKAANQFLSYMALNTWVLDARVGWASIPREWKREQPERWQETTESMNRLAGKVLKAHQALITTARSALRI